jgi:hypothetical protein
MTVGFIGHSMLKRIIPPHLERILDDKTQNLIKTSVLSSRVNAVTLGRNIKHSVIRCSQFNGNPLPDVDEGNANRRQHRKFPRRYNLTLFRGKVV